MLIIFFYHEPLCRGKPRRAGARLSCGLLRHNGYFGRQITEQPELRSRGSEGSCSRDRLLLNGSTSRSRRLTSTTRQTSSSRTSLCSSDSSRPCCQRRGRIAPTKTAGVGYHLYDVPVESLIYIEATGGLSFFPQTSV